MHACLQHRHWHQGLCQACDIGGSLGTCVNIPAGQDPDAECPGAGYCDGNGACL